MHAKSLQSCPTLCNPMDCSPPGSLVHGDSPGKNTGVGYHALLQGTFTSRDRTHVFFISYIGRRVLYHLCHLGSLVLATVSIKYRVMGLFLSSPLQPATIILPKEAAIVIQAGTRHPVTLNIEKINSIYLVLSWTTYLLIFHNSSQ